MRGVDMRCVDCGKDTSADSRDYFMVKDELWDKYGVGRKLLCVGCFEKRLGRKLRREDLTDCIVNTQWNEYTKKILGTI